MYQYGVPYAHFLPSDRQFKQACNTRCARILWIQNQESILILAHNFIVEIMTKNATVTDASDAFKTVTFR